MALRPSSVTINVATSVSVLGWISLSPLVTNMVLVHWIAMLMMAMTMMIDLF